jgi:hypothetical protein
MDFISSDTYSGSKVREEPPCKCGAQPMIARKMMDLDAEIPDRAFDLSMPEQS